jgi:hypothetical protein
MNRAFAGHLLAWAIAITAALPSPAWAQASWPQDCKQHRIASFPMTVKGGHVPAAAAH